MKYLLGIDNGGTFSKAVVFDINGNQIGLGIEPTVLEKNKDNFQERQLEVLWQANVSAIKQAIHNSGISPSDIIGISFSGHGKGLYLLDKNDKDLGKGILSTDNRAAQIVSSLEFVGIKSRIYDITSQNMIYCHPAALLLWIKEYQPEIYRCIGTILSVKDYVRFRLTGTKNTDYSDASGNNLINLETKKYDKKIFDILGIPEMFESLPELVSSHVVCGYVHDDAAKETGLKSGTPVVAGAFDINACGIACGMVKEDDLCMIAGTWSINEYISKCPVNLCPTTLKSLYCLDDYYLIEESSPTSAGNLEWYINSMLNQKLSYEDINFIVQEQSPNTSNLMYLPYIDGNNINGKAKGSFIGLDRQTTFKESLRAIYEGVVFSHAVHVHKLLLNRERPRVIRIAGGAAKSSVWVQMFADVIQIPIETIAVDELGAFGAAVLAGIGVGVYKNYGDILHTIRVAHHYEPNLEYRKIYACKLARFQQLSELLNRVW